MDFFHRSMLLRVNSCQQVLADVGQRLSREEVHPRIVDQLERLNELLELIDHRVVNEKDLVRIEGSTNQLLHEIGTLFNHSDLGTLYDHTLQ